jgi:hypothetical protein
MGALLALPSCSGGGDVGPEWVVPPEVRRPPAAVRPTLAPATDQLPAADPRLDGFDGWPISFRAAHADPTRQTCEIAIARGATPVRTLEGTLDASRCSAIWDVTNDAGDEVRPGLLQATGRILEGPNELARSEVTLEVVRVGIDRLALNGARAPLLYRRTAGLEDGWYEVGIDHIAWQLAPDRGETGGVPLELPDGRMRSPVLPWADVLSPPLDARSVDGVEHDTFSLPTAWIAGSEITVAARMTASIAGVPGGGAPSPAVEIRLVAPEGLMIEGDEAFRDGATVFLGTTGSPVPSVDRYDVTWSFGFEARAVPDGEWQPLPGAFPTTVRLYGLVAMPSFDSPTVPHRAWVDVVDRVAGWVDGAASDANGVARELVDGIYWDTALRYDTARGASFYTSYASGFSGASFYMQEFEERDFGRVVNCSDAASILSAYANMVGIDLRYHILTNAGGIDLGFDLNFIRAIGVAAFDDTPFDSGRGGFRYHAITGTPDGRTWDATLAVDGDGAPASMPNTLLLVQGLDPTVYLQDLSSQWMQIRTDLNEKVRIR